MNPLVPKTRGNLVIVDARVGNDIIGGLEKLGLHIIKTTSCDEVHESISYHPDIQVNILDRENIIVAPNVADYYLEKFKDFKLNIIVGETSLGLEYPRDIPYNLARIGNCALHNFKYTDKLLLNRLKEEKLELVNVRQGYTKCSLGLIGEKEGITSDIPIYNKLTRLGYDILLIKPGYIKLPGQKYGFIGGSMGTLAGDKVVFSGSLKNHPDCHRIEKFLEKHEKQGIFLSSQEIIDIGTIMFLEV